MARADAISLAALILVLARGIVQLWLSRRNRRWVLAHAHAVPDAFQASVDPATYARSVQYTLAKARLSRFETVAETVVLLAVLFSGVLPAAFGFVVGGFGTAAWAMAAFLMLISLALAAVDLPLAWYAQFHLEERFGFNTTSIATWWTDRAKGFTLALFLGYPLLLLVLKLVSWTGPWWWLWAWGCVFGFQWVLVAIAPVLIMPWFNQFTPLPDGTLRRRLLAVAERAGFRTQNVQVMDGSKRSRHSNAFFTGFGRFRKIVLFDTLIQQVTEPELAAVLAHELGHWKLKHIAKSLAASAVAMLAGSYLLSGLAAAGSFYTAFGFRPGNITPALLVFGLLSGVVGFWFTPLFNTWSRRHEYQADAFAATLMGETASLIGGLRKLHERNLSNLTPDPVYSFFFYSHPTLLERERALAEMKDHR